MTKYIVYKIKFYGGTIIRAQSLSVTHVFFYKSKLFIRTRIDLDKDT